MQYKTHKFTLLIVIAMFAISAVGLLMTIYEKPPISFENVPFPLTVEKEYRPGDEIAFVIERCVTRPVQYTLTQSFVPENARSIVEGFSIESHEIIVTQVGCEIVSPIKRTIPNTLPSGTYHIRFGIAVEGRFKDFIFNVESADFKIVSDAKDIEIADMEQSLIQPLNPLIPIQPIAEPQVIRETTIKETKTTNNNTTTTNTNTVVEEPKNEPIIPTLINKIF